ncbi:hypothetical protein E4U11_005771 [Claviceps purpurea]|nr:hypothetical protein E4U11_005771 [Claviceps purpurea]
MLVTDGSVRGDRAVGVATKPDEVTQGPVVDAEYRRRPRIICWSKELGEEQLKMLQNLPSERIITSGKGLATRSWLGTLKHQVQPIDSEVSLDHRQDLIAIRPLIALIENFQRDAALEEEFKLHGDVLIREHLNGVRITTNTIESEPNPPERRSRADIFCSFRTDQTKDPENGDLLWVGENKSPTKLVYPVAQLVLPNSMSEGEIDVQKCMNGNETEEKYSSQRSSCSSTRPLLALKDPGTSEEWKAVAAKRPRWFSQRVNQNNIKLDRETPEDDITPYYGKPLDSRDRERDLRVTRSASQSTHHPPNEVDNEKEVSGSGSKMGSSHIDRREFLRLMGEQLVGKDAHAHFKPINASGHIRYLFKGRFIPACPGLIPLHGVFGGQVYDYIAFRHFLFLSYAGKPVLKALSKVDNSVVNL